MKALFLAASALSAMAVAAGGSAPARADDAWTESLILNMRLRYETVDQDGLAQTASAATLRTRLGFETPRRNGFSVLLEGENTTHLTGDFADTITPSPGYPVIADPEVTELNRAQLSWRGGPDATVTLGQQWFAMGDQRFAGPVGFRQNSQSVDALRVSSGTLWPVTLDYAYIDRVHRIFGDDHPLGEFDSASHAGEARMDTPLGEVAAFALLLDFDNAPALSSQTLGLRLSGTRAAIAYRLEVANQADYGSNTGDFDLTYVRAEADYRTDRFSVGGGVEVLGGDGTQGFQTPLATLHKFQGAADVFLSTPADGLRDIHVRGSWRFPDADPGPAHLSFAWHDFRSDDGDFRYGSELDLVAGLSLTDRLTAEAKAALFDGAAGGPADRTKVWVALVFDY